MKMRSRFVVKSLNILGGACKLFIKANFNSIKALNYLLPNTGLVNRFAIKITSDDYYFWNTSVEKAKQRQQESARIFHTVCQLGVKPKS